MEEEQNVNRERKGTHKRHIPIKMEHSNEMLRCTLHIMQQAFLSPIRRSFRTPSHFPLTTAIDNGVHAIGDSFAA